MQPAADIMDLNVGLVLDSPARGGVEQHVRQLVIGLRSRGLNVTLFCTDLPAHDRLAMAAKAADVEVQRSSFVTPNTASMRLAGLVVHANRCILLARMLRARDIQIVHAHVPGFAGARWSMIAAKLASVPTVVFTVHTAPPRRQSWTTRLERRLLNCIVDGYVAVSHATRNDQIRHLGQSCAKTDRKSVV